MIFTKIFKEWRRKKRRKKRLDAVALKIFTKMHNKAYNFETVDNFCYNHILNILYGNMHKQEYKANTHIEYKFSDNGQICSTEFDLPEIWAVLYNYFVGIYESEKTLKKGLERINRAINYCKVKRYHYFGFPYSRDSISTCAAIIVHLPTPVQNCKILQMLPRTYNLVFTLELMFILLNLSLSRSSSLFTLGSDDNIIQVLKDLISNREDTVGGIVEAFTRIRALNSITKEDVGASLYRLVILMESVIPPELKALFKYTNKISEIDTRIIRIMGISWRIIMDFKKVLKDTRIAASTLDSYIRQD